MNFQGLIFFVTFISLHAHGHSSTPEWAEYVKQLKEQQRNYVEEAVESRASRAVGTDFFEIDFTSPPEPITVHSLRPENIDVVAALGDSITAGTGIDATTVAGIANQYRGLTWTAGGDLDLAQSITIPNILRHFNPTVKGHSVGIKIDFDILEQDWFNVAVPGGRAKDMTQQTEWLIERMRSDNRTSFENEWKLISIFIGGNDLCDLGSDPIGASPDTYRNEIKAALDLMHQEIPRALVQIIQIMEIYLLPQVSTGYMAPPRCNFTQQIACSHVVDSVKDDEMLQELKELNWRYQELVKEMVNSGRYDTRDDFTVVIQPFFENTRLPTTEDGQVDATYFAPDCFHFSSKGHAMGALNVWNNMLEPDGSKTTEWEVNDLACPSEDHPYVFTRLNSAMETKRSLKKRDAPIIPRKEDKFTCQEVKCKSTPDWTIGVMCALVGVMGLQILLIGCLMKQSKNKSYILSGERSSYSSYSL